MKYQIINRKFACTKIVHIINGIKTNEQEINGKFIEGLDWKILFLQNIVHYNIIEYINGFEWLFADVAHFEVDW